MTLISCSDKKGKTADKESHQKGLQMAPYRVEII